MGEETINEEAIKRFMKMNSHMTRCQAVAEMIRWS